MADNRKGVRAIEVNEKVVLRELFAIGSYKVMIRDVVWLMVIILCAGIVVLGMLVKNSSCALNAISAASTLLSIVLSFIAIIKSMIDSADSARVNSRTEECLYRLDKQIELLFSESEIHKKNESELKEKLGSLCEILSMVAKFKDIEGKDKDKLVEKLSDSAVFEEVNKLNSYFTDYFN